jgi:predicted dinucleotide-binding enzyme
MKRAAVPLSRIAVLGAGHVGPVIARVAVAAGHHVTIAASGEPERIALIAGVPAPGAEPHWVSLRRAEFEPALRAEVA